MATIASPTATTSQLNAAFDRLAPQFRGDTWLGPLNLAYLGLVAQVQEEAAQAAALIAERLASCCDRGAQGPGPREGATAIDEEMAVSRARGAGDLVDGQAGAASWGLTPREVEVLRLLTAGRADREIAAALFISHRTVHHHVAKIYAKLGVNSRVAAAHVARGVGLVADRVALSQ